MLTLILEQTGKCEVRGVKNSYSKTSDIFRDFADRLDDADFAIQVWKDTNNGIDLAGITKWVMTKLVECQPDNQK